MKITVIDNRLICLVNSDMHHLTLWNLLPSSFHQPLSVHSPPGSPHLAHITSSQSPPLLSPSITPSTFHSRLKTYLFQTYLFHKSFPW